MIALPKPMVDETLEDFIMRAMDDFNMIREYPGPMNRQFVATSRWQETQLSRDFYVAVAETLTDSLVADPMDSKGKIMAEPGEPLTDPQTQKF